jgi:hypothetical protein
MTTDEPFRIYYDRWLALDVLIDKAIVAYSNMDVFDRQGTIVSLLHSLRAFATSQFQFFYFGFQPLDPARLKTDPLVQTWDEFPPEDVLTGIINQISHDLDLIQRAADQRLVAKLSANFVVQDALRAADQLTWLALLPAMKHNIIETPEIVLTYFEKAAEFYTIPYAKVALIAVPYTCTMEGNHLDFLAIPHEAGHYVYRHLIPDAKNALKALTDSATIPAIYRGWVTTVFEEMCADIYGCLIGGPVMAMDFQALALANSQTEFSDGDNQHPNAVIRPLIYCQVLANPDVRGLIEVGSDWRTIAGALAKEWSGRLRERHLDYFVIKLNRTEGQNQVVAPQRQPIATDYIAVPKLEGPDQYGALGDVVNELINTLINYVTDNGKKPEPHDLQGWAGKIDSKTNPADLFDGYRAWYDGNIDTAKLSRKPWPSPEYPFPDDPAFSKESPSPYKQPNRAPEEWRNRLPAEQRNIKPWPAKNIIPSGEVKDPTKMEAGTWGYILYAEGWTTEGPSDDYKHPLI